MRRTYLWGKPVKKSFTLSICFNEVLSQNILDILTVSIAIMIFPTTLSFLHDVAKKKHFPATAMIHISYLHKLLTVYCGLGTGSVHIMFTLIFSKCYIC